MKTINNYIFEKLHINKDIDLTDVPKTIKEYAYDIVSYYFGGELPDSLDEEGMKCSTDTALYDLIDQIEIYYVDDHKGKIEWEENEEDSIHFEVTELIKKLNNK